VESSSLEAAWRDALRSRASVHPHLAILAASVGQFIVADPEVSDVELNPEGGFRVNPQFARRVGVGAVAGAVLHKALHVVHGHAGRRGGRSESRWWTAADMILNGSLQNAGVQLPPGSIHAPVAYDGPWDVESLFAWLEDRQRSSRGRRWVRTERDGAADVRALAHPGTSEERSKTWAEPPRTANIGIGRYGVCRGCGVGEQALNGAVGGALAELTGFLERAAAPRLERLSGGGLEALERQLSVRPPRVKWADVLARAVRVLKNVPGHGRPAWNRPNRRMEPFDEVIMPSWVSHRPRVAVIVDASGSMGGGAVETTVNEIGGIAVALSGEPVWLGVHTDRTCFGGLVRGQDRTSLVRAVSCTGGTDPTSTYELLGKQGRIDLVVHFTDCVFAGQRWPALPGGARLVVGDFGDPGPWCTAPPAGSIVIPCLRA